MSVVQLWDDLAERLRPVFAEYRGHIADLPVEVKADKTLLTEADVTVQQIIIDAIQARKPAAVVIAEEDERQGTRDEVASAAWPGLGDRSHRRNGGVRPGGTSRVLLGGVPVGGLAARVGLRPRPGTRGGAHSTRRDGGCA